MLQQLLICSLLISYNTSSHCLKFTIVADKKKGHFHAHPISLRRLACIGVPCGYKIAPKRLPRPAIPSRAKGRRTFVRWGTI